MSQVSLPPDDFPPAQVTAQDKLWFHQFEESVSRCFYESCDGVIQALLMKCEWNLSLQAGVLTLNMNCPDQSVNWRLLNNIGNVATHLAGYSKHAKIRVCPPLGLGNPFEMRVDEASMH